MIALLPLILTTGVFYVPLFSDTPYDIPIKYRIIIAEKKILSFFFERSVEGAFRSMLLKWIVCSIPEEQQEAFARSQTHWQALREVPGFLGRIGGWAGGSPPCAAILALWQDEVCYQQFMQEQHRQMLQACIQDATYNIQTTTLFHDLSPISGTETNLLTALSISKLLRVTDAQTFPERAEAFLHNQLHIWNPDMERSAGLHSGVLAQSRTDPHRYLVASLWQNRQAHQLFLSNIFPQLRLQFKLPQTVQHIKGWYVQLEHEWLVLP
jgi:quinol monooxygenase YgiN